MQETARCPLRVLVFAASMREASLNAKLVALVEEIVANKGAEVVHGSMRDYDCPSYDGDLEESQGLPAGAQKLHDALRDCDAFIIASPEYNASMPGILKNVIDWTSRFRPQPFNGKQGFLMSASPSMAGGNRGLWSLRIPLEHLGARIYPDMFSLAQAHEAFTADGHLTRSTTEQRLASTLSCFLDITEASKHYGRMKKEWVEFLGEHPNAATDRVEASEVTAQA
jgi:NAD(P)H-dependent FMN reductase